MLENPPNWAISSQAPEESGEGSTTRAWSPDRTVKPHERAAGKVCTKCNLFQTEFHKGAVWCRQCVKAYDKAIYAEKREQVLERKRLYRAANKERVAEAHKAWLAKNPGYSKPYLKKYKAEYIDRPGVRAKRNQERMERVAQVKRATPAWADPDVIRLHYIYARAFTEMFGEPYHVDHIVPLKGRNVCGLHVGCNLQVITGSQNSIKKNRLLDDVV